MTMSPRIMGQADSASKVAFTTLDEWYRGEVGGEALFLALAAVAADAGCAAKWRTLAALERATKERLEQSIRSLGGTLPDPSPDPDLARERVAALQGKAWPELMRWLEQIAADALEVMTRESVSLPASLNSTVAWVLDHERALLDFARHELAGDGVRSLARAHDMLSMTERAG